LGEIGQVQFRDVSTFEALNDAILMTE
jgi:hypothetical protein